MTTHFLRVIGPFNCQPFQRPLPVSSSVTPAHPNGSAAEGKLEIVTMRKANDKQRFVNFCALYSP